MALTTTAHAGLTTRFLSLAKFTLDVIGQRVVVLGMLAYWFLPVFAMLVPVV
jgi:hypothetical protein